MEDGSDSSFIEDYKAIQRKALTVLFFGINLTLVVVAYWFLHSSYWIQLVNPVPGDEANLMVAADEIRKVSIDTSGWNKYKNLAYNYEVSYPADWNISDKAVGKLPTSSTPVIKPVCKEDAECVKFEIYSNQTDYSPSVSLESYRLAYDQMRKIGVSYISVGGERAKRDDFASTKVSEENQVFFSHIYVLHKEKIFHFFITYETAPTESVEYMRQLKYYLPTQGIIDSYQFTDK